MISTIRLVALVTAGVLAFGACSSSSSNKTSSPTTTAATSEAPTTAATPATGASSSSCPGLSGNVSNHGSAAASGANLNIEASDFFFSPTCETGVQQGTVTLSVKNTGQALHNVSVPDQGIDMDVPADQTITVRVKVGGGGVSYFCKYHRTSGMVGSLAAAG